MKRYLWSMLLGLAAISAKAQVGAFNGVCENGGRHATVSGLNATNFQLGVIPSCTITVYLTGTTNKATIFADAIGTPLANPFTGAVVGSTAPGQWLFYAATAVGYDVVMSGGIAPNTFPTPVTLTDLQSGGGGGGGGVSSFSAGNLLPLFTTTVTNATTAPNLAFTFSNTGTLNFFGQVGGSTGPPSFIHFVAGSNITLTPSGGNTLTFAATGGGLCGPLSTDSTSTNCGNNNFFSTPSTSNAQAYGSSNIAKINSASQIVAAGSSSVTVSSGTVNLVDIIGIGNNAVSNPVTGSADWVVLGDEAAANSGGNDHVAIGNNAGSSASGNSQVAIGNGAGLNISGNDFVAIGDGAGLGNTSAAAVTGTDIVAVGDGAVESSFQSGITDFGTDIVAVGDGAANNVSGAANVVGIGNSAAGGRSAVPTFNCLVTGHDIIGIGDYAGLGITGHDNVAIGDRVMGGLIDSSHCVGVPSGNDNIGIGDHSLAGLTTGNNNLAVGFYAGANGYTAYNSIGNSNQTGSNNTWLGYGTGPNTTTQLSNTIALGANAVNTASNQMVLGNSSITATTIYGLGTGCLSVASGVVTGSGSSCGTGGGGASNVTVNGGSTLTTANFNGSTPAAGTNGINVTWQASGSSVSAEVVGDGVSTHFLNGTGAFSAPAGSGTVTSIATTSPLGGGTITTSGTLTCTTCVVASSPAAGLAHFAGSTQTVTSSAANLASADVTGLLPHANIASTAVTPGSYTSANITVAADGSITAASNGSAGGVTSTSNSDGTLTISPTTGAVVASLALGHANTWTAVQTFTAGSGVSLSVGAFSTLATCGSGTAPEGTVAGVNDSTTNTWGATIAGSGSLHVMAYCDGSGNWTVAAK